MRGSVKVTACGARSPGHDRRSRRIHALFLQNLTDKDDLVRAAAEEGLGRLKNPTDRSALNQAFETTSTA